MKEAEWHQRKMLKRSSSAVIHSCYFCILSMMSASSGRHCRHTTLALCLCVSCDWLRQAALPPSAMLREASTIFLLVGLESVQYLIMGLISFFCTNVFSTHWGCLKDLTRVLSGQSHFIVRTQGHEGRALPTLQAGVSVFYLNLKDGRIPREAMGFPRL